MQACIANRMCSLDEQWINILGEKHADFLYFSFQKHGKIYLHVALNVKDKNDYTIKRETRQGF